MSANEECSEFCAHGNCLECDGCDDCTEIARLKAERDALKKDNDELCAKYADRILVNRQYVEMCEHEKIVRECNRLATQLHIERSVAEAANFSLRVQLENVERVKAKLADTERERDEMTTEAKWLNSECAKFIVQADEAEAKFSRAMVVVDAARALDTAPEFGNQSCASLDALEAAVAEFDSHGSGE